MTYAFGENKGNHKINKGYHSIGFKIKIGRADKTSGTLHDIWNCQNGYQWCILQHGNAFISYRRKDSSPGLGQYDKKHGLEPIETERPRSFALPFWNCHYACPEHFSHVCAITDTNRSYRAGYAADLEKTWKRIINIEKLYQERNAANNFHIGGSKKTDKAVARYSAQTG